jgi:nucleoside-diphosphate-sugar epimerase
LAAPRKALVTGCAGFIGSHLAERLVDDGFEVVGVDCFTGNYARAAKESNLERLRAETAFEMREVDLAADVLHDLLDGVDDVYHLAAQTSVRASFGVGYRHYVRNNMAATSRLLAAAARTPLLSFVYASSSSVYGDALELPTPETAPLQPISPYGMTKAAVEDLAAGAWRDRGVPVVGLRYFTAYGPRQRPDMAFSRFIAAALAGEPVELLGDGRQVRDFTYVDDVVDATRAAAHDGEPGAVYNVGGGEPVELREAIAVIGELTARPLRVAPRAPARGDVACTAADMTLAERELGVRASTSLVDGLAAQLDWKRSRDIVRV